MSRTTSILSAAVALLLLSTAAQARQRPYRSNPPQEYAYGFSLDIQAGPAGMPYVIRGDERAATGMSGGGEFQLRANYYFGRHWGAFVSYSYNGGSAAPVNFLSVVNRADGDFYKYSGDQGFWFDNCMGYEVSTLLAGAAYRYDRGQWSIRPRVGIGAASSTLSSSPYVRLDRADGTPLIQYIFTDEPKSNDFYDDQRNYCRWGFAAYAGVQATYTFRHHFYFSFECGFKAFTANRNYSREAYDYRPAYHPENWPEAVAQEELRNSYEVDLSSCRTSPASRPWALLNINFGIGWNIGWNRYESGRYH